MARLLSLISIVTALAACDARIGKEAEKADPRAKLSASPPVASPSGKAKDGQFSIDAPGFAMKIDIPAGVTSRGHSNSDMLYPGSTLSGMHIEGGRATGKGRSDAGIELRFTTPDVPDRVAAWYQNPARARGFTVASIRREGKDVVLAGSEKENGDPFSLRLRPRTGGGTEGRLTLTDRS